MARSGYPGSQSPQANRGSAQDYTKFQKGEVQTGMSNPTKSNDPAWDNQGELATGQTDLKGSKPAEGGPAGDLRGRLLAGWREIRRMRSPALLPIA